jgi:hypothetical protein
MCRAFLFRLPVLALSRHVRARSQCPLVGMKRTSRGHVAMSAFDPKRKSGTKQQSAPRHAHRSSRDSFGLWVVLRASLITATNITGRRQFIGNGYFTWNSAEAPSRRQPADKYQSGAGTEHPTPSTASQHQQAANDHCDAAASTEHPTPITHSSTCVHSR